MVRRQRQLLKTTAAALALALSACQRGHATAGIPSDPVDAPSQPRGQMTLHVPRSSQLGEIASFSVHLQFWLLSSPPALYFEYQGSDSFPQLPCLAPDAGTQTQVLGEATVRFAGDPATYTAHSSALFTCKRSQDVTLVLPFDIFRTSNPDIGGDDALIALGGSKCSSSVALRGDAWLAVCANASCDAASAAFLFSNACSGLDGAAPDSWVCGTGADWSLVGPLARAQFPVPSRDGQWTFGLAAFPRQVLAILDPTLTDPQKNRRVFGLIGAPRARLSRQGGVLQPPVLEAGRTAAHVALLDAPSSAGVHPQLLVQIEDAPAGGLAYIWTGFGGCDVPAAGVASWSGLHPVDVRLDGGLSAVRVLLSSAANGVATAQAKCSTGLDATGNPIATCTAAGPLGGTP